MLTKKPLLMKKLIVIISSLLLSISVKAQTEISLDNSLSGSLNQGKTNIIGVNFTGNNSFDFGKHVALDLGTNYNVQYTPELSQNELIQKANFGYNKEHWDLFTTYQYNYSLVRSIQADNWLGIGGGVKEKFNWGKASLSYAFLYQNTDYMVNPNTNKLRHSIRAKIKIEKKSFGLSTEYYYQPNIKDFNDCIIYGTTKLTLFPTKPFNFIIQDQMNFRSTSDVQMINNLTFGIAYKFVKKIVK
jgi:hypothetical protein